MRLMYGVEFQVPAGKLPGFYAQVIHKIGDNVNVFDRDGQLFIVENEEEQAKLEAVLTKPNMLGDVFALLLLPDGTQITHLEDAGFVSQSDHVYMYADRVAMFSVDEHAGDAQDRWAAQEQWKEHVLGQIPSYGSMTPVFIMDSSLTELVEGIAQAYRTSISWLHPAGN